MNFASCLKSPISLVDVWFRAVKETKSPLTYKVAMSQYWKSLLKVKTEAEVLQIRDEQLLDWPSVLFGNQPLDTGLSCQECWTIIRESNSDILKVLPEEMPPL